MNFIKKLSCVLSLMAVFAITQCYGAIKDQAGMVKITIVNQSSESFCLKGQNAAHCVHAGASDSFRVQSRYFYTRFGLLTYWEQDKHNQKKILLAQNGKTLDVFIQPDKNILAAGIDKRVGMDLDLYLTWHPLGSLF